MPTVAKPPKSLRARLPRVLAKAKPAGLMTSEDFLHWLEPSVFADLISGEIHMHSPVNLRHADLTNFADSLLRNYLEAVGIPGKLHRESVAVRLSLRDTFMPDLGFYTPHQVAQFSETYVRAAPMFCVEVLSPSTAKNDRGRKFAAYELHGVQEYWLLDPQKLEHHFFRREGDLLVEFAVDEDRIDSAMIRGFWIKRAWLDPENLPKVSACLREILKPRRRS
jgi:Uma2 family endonuclease